MDYEILSGEKNQSDVFGYSGRPVVPLIERLLVLITSFRDSSALLVAVVSLGACSILKASPAPDAGFLKSPQKLTSSDRLPFHAVWISEQYKARHQRYENLHIRKVDTSYLMRTGDWQHIRIKSTEQIKRDVRGLAKRMKRVFEETFRESDKCPFSLIDKPRPHTLLLELAIVELVPTDIVRNAAGNVAGFIVPGGSLASLGAGGIIAVEGRFVDADTKEVLLMFKDRESDHITPIDLAGLTPYRHAEHHIQAWAEQLVELLAEAPEYAVEEDSPFRLLPW